MNRRVVGPLEREGLGCGQGVELLFRLSGSAQREVMDGLSRGISATSDELAHTYSRQLDSLPAAEATLDTLRSLVFAGPSHKYATPVMVRSIVAVLRCG